MIEELGWLDTNIFVHSLFRNDPLYQRCHTLVHALKDGRARGTIDVTVLHELTYVLSRQSQFRGREDVQHYLEAILHAPGVQAADKDALVETLRRWAAGSDFVDAWLRNQADLTGLPVCSANVRHFPDVQNSFLNATV